MDGHQITVLLYITINTVHHTVPVRSSERYRTELRLKYGPFIRESKTAKPPKDISYMNDPCDHHFDF